MPDDNNPTEIPSQDDDRFREWFLQTPAFLASLSGPEHRVQEINTLYRRLIRQEAVVGTPLADLCPELGKQGVIPLLDDVFQTGNAAMGSKLRIRLPASPGSYTDERVLDFTYQPLLDAEGNVTGILAHGIDVTIQHLLEEERERLVDEQRRLLIEARAFAKREALINQIGEAARAALQPQEVLAIAVKALGTALAADRCYYATYDIADDFGRINPDWQRPGLTSIAGDYRLSDYVVNQDKNYLAGRTQVVNDVKLFAPPPSDGSERSGVTLMEELGLRSIVRAPLQSDGQITALAVAMAGGPRQWTAEEVRLVETVAAQTRAAVESARVQHRERNIAIQLQEVLIPARPPHLPGLKLASYYRPALEEAGVGGDGFDVFALEKGCTALTVFDLSGKGLEAARQTATVRNMLRYALYTARSIAEAVSSLHKVLAEQELLTGFATLFLGVYDHAYRTITYVNCGQEPGLILRKSDNRIEELGATGPVLGGFLSGTFTERMVRLEPGDVLALFTDGLTEIGPNRRNLLEVAGVSRYLQEIGTSLTADDRCDPHIIVPELISRVDRFAGNGLRDDIALLLGVVQTS